MDRRVSVIEDLDGKKTVFIHDILFKGKRSVNWMHIAKLIGRVCGAKRPHSVSKQPISTVFG